MSSSIGVLIAGFVMGLIAGVLFCDLGFSGWNDRFDPRTTNQGYEQTQQRKDFDHYQRMQDQNSTYRKEPC